MEKYVLKHFDRPEPDMIQFFEKLDVSTVYEAQEKTGLLDHHIRPILQDILIAGPAVTVICHAGDNLMIHAAIEVCKPGDILVVTTIGDFEAGMVGELIASALMKKGVRGMVIDSGIRDVSGCDEWDFPSGQRRSPHGGPPRLVAAGSMLLLFAAGFSSVRVIWFWLMMTGL
jgi:4-hydroxy-4-methyl-2-oxoglutarate aldolase